MARKRKGCLLHAISLIGLAAGLFCLYRAIAPILQMYSNALSDPLGNSHADPDVTRIQHEAFIWAPIGIACIVCASIISWVATIGWIRNKVAGKSDPHR